MRLTTVPVPGPFGISEIIAPHGPQYDRTAAVAWSRLLTLSRQRKRTAYLLNTREKAELDAKIEVLCLLLGDTTGNPPDFWGEAVKDLTPA